MTIELKEYDLDDSTFMGGWYLPEDICDRLIAFYHKNENLVEPGTVVIKGKDVVERESKDSSDLVITPDLTMPPIGDYRVLLQSALELYIKKYPKADAVHKFNVTKTYNIQYYEPGGGFKKWHCERSQKTNGDRHLVFMTYLNDLEDGGTEFYHQKLKIPARKGLTLIWPTDWTHTHKGVISQTQEKYIVTGWFNFLDQ